MKSFSGQVIWITGASSGIGEALAFAFSRHKSKLILSARSTAQLESTKKKCIELGLSENDVKILTLDLGKQQEFPEKIREAIKFFGHIDMLINNAGQSQRSYFKETGMDVVRQLMEVNFFGTVALTKGLLPHFIERNSGTIVVVSSLVGKFGTPLRSAYSASKHALHGLFDSLRAELPKENFQITIICPGFIKTNISQNALTSDGSKQGTLDKAQAQGMDSDTFAKKMLEAIANKKEEAYIGKREVMGIYLKRFIPTLFSKVIRKAKVT